MISDGGALQRAVILEDALERIGGALEDFGASASGDEVPALAGTKNCQGRGLSGAAAFLHVELSDPVRSALRADDALRGRLGDALEATAR